MRVRVVDLDGVGAQPAIAARNPAVVAARDLGPKIRLWSSERVFETLRTRIAITPVAGEGPMVTFLGSGDFNNVTPLLLEAEAGPMVVIHLDNHPDWVRLAPRRHCGAWVNRALELPQVVRVITVGVTSADIDRPDSRGGGVDHLAAGRIVMLPWRREPSPVRKPLADGPGHRVKDGRVVWREVGRDWDAFLADIPTMLPDGASIWLSIDKDVLRPEDAATNWDQGAMPLDALEDLITRAASLRPIAGVDICGDWSAPAYDTPLKAIEAHFDRPKGYSRAMPDAAVNDRTNARLLAVLETALASPATEGVAA